MIETFLPGTDIPTRLKFKSKGGLIKFPDLLDFQLYVYTMSGHRKNVIETYKKADTGKTKIAIVPGVDGEISFVINRERTGNMYNVLLYAELYVQEAATSDFIDSLMYEAVSGIELCKIGVSAKNPH